MANLFDADNAPILIPEKFTAGDFVQWKDINLALDYPVSTHTATFFGRKAQGGASEFNVIATSPGNYYLFTIPSSVSEDIPPDDYHWQLQITQNATNNSIVISIGQLTVLGDLDENNTDPRIHAEIMVKKIESLLSGKADSDVAEYSIAGRQLTKMPFKDLIDARDYYRREIVVYISKERAKLGLSTASTIVVRF